MYDHTITVFNYHANTGMWYPSVIERVDLIENKGGNSTTSGKTSADVVDVIIHCSADRTVATTAGEKSYTRPKEYAVCIDPVERITFKPECDFIYDGVWPDLTPISDDGYESGLYHAMNDEHDGVYMIASAIFYGLLPHFEIGGR